MLPRALVSALLMLAMVVTVHLARAEVAIAVVVRGTSASAIDETKLTTLIRLELGSGERATSIDRIAVEITGSRPRAVIITITNRDGAVRSSDLDIDLGGGNAERAIALFVGELSRANVDAAPPPAAPTPPPAPATSPAPVVDAPPRAPDHKSNSNNGVMLDARGSGRLIGLGASKATPMLGVAIAAGIGLGDRARVGLNARYGVASADDPLGNVNARTASGGVHAAYRLFPTGQSSQSKFFIDTGPRAMIGWIGGEGTSGAAIAKANSTSGVVVEGAWFADATFIVARPIGIVLGLEAGWLGPGLDLRADDRRVLRVAGAFAGVSLGFAVLP